jgi:hypothetical protein
MSRVTARDLEVRVNLINRTLKTDYALNNAPHYGGWQLTSDNGSHIVHHRVSPKEMKAYLDGLVWGITATKNRIREVQGAKG